MLSSTNAVVSAISGPLREKIHSLFGLSDMALGPHQTENLPTTSTIAPRLCNESQINVKFITVRRAFGTAKTIAQLVRQPHSRQGALRFPGGRGALRRTRRGKFAPEAQHGSVPKGQVRRCVCGAITASFWLWTATQLHLAVRQIPGGPGGGVGEGFGGCI